MILAVFLPIESTEAIQRDDGWPWMHGMIAESNSTNHNGWSYKVRVIKTGSDKTLHKGHWKDSNNNRTIPKRADC